MSPIGALGEDARLRGLLGLAAVLVIIQGLRELASVIDPLLMATVVVMCVQPLQRRLRKLGWGPRLALTGAVGTMFAILGAFAALLGYAAAALVRTVPQYQDRFNTLWADATAFAARRGIDLSQSQLADLVSPGRVLALVQQGLGTVGGALSGTLLILVLAIFLILEYGSTAKGIGLPKGEFERRLLRVTRDVQQYLWITTLTALMFAGVVWVTLLALGVDLATLWAVLAFVLSFVPAVGFVISMIPPVALALLKFGMAKAVVVAAMFLVANTVIDNVVKPRIMAEDFEISMFVLFAALLFWSFVFGPIGALLSVPLTMAVKRFFFDDEPREPVPPPAPAG